MEKVDTVSQTADIFTKPLNSELFFKHCKSLGLTHKPLTVCSLCHLSFTSKNTLHKHIRTSHVEKNAAVGEKRAGEEMDEEGGRLKRNRKDAREP